MNFLERFILARSEKHLKKYRCQAKELDKYFLDAYRTYLPTIKNCYGSAKYWHGTGRYHYHNIDDARYEHTSSISIINVLESIFEQGGLVGHPDLWFQDTYTKKTVSVAPSRMHARLFAHIHLREGVWLPYVFGGTRFWMSLIFMLIAARSSKEELRFIVKVLFQRGSLQHFRMWGSSIRKLDGVKTLPSLWRAYDFRSDIQGNHAVLFGIQHAAIPKGSLLPAIKEFETRVGNIISLSAITHVEVPLENVEETKRLLAEKNISLPVIPLEFGELYVSQFPLKDLMYA